MDYTNKSEVRRARRKITGKAWGIFGASVLGAATLLGYSLHLMNKKSEIPQPAQAREIAVINAELGILGGMYDSISIGLKRFNNEGGLSPDDSSVVAIRDRYNQILESVHTETKNLVDKREGLENTPEMRAYNQVDWPIASSCFGAPLVILLGSVGAYQYGKKAKERLDDRAFTANTLELTDLFRD